MTNKLKQATKTVLVTAVLASALAPTASANGIEFTDVPETNVHYDNIYNLAERAVISGYPDGTYQPARHLTRAEAAVILSNALNLDTSNVTERAFWDVNPDAWYADEVTTLADYGIITGYPNGKFKPNEKLTRAQMATILSAAYDLEIFNEVDLPFTDVIEDSWYDMSVQELYRFEVTAGLTPSKFEPNEFVRRDTMASFVVNAESVPEEDIAEEWMDYSVGFYNALEGYKSQVAADVDTNQILVTIPQSPLEIEDTYLAAVAGLLLPIFEMQEVYVKGQSVDLTTLDMDSELYDYLMEQLEVAFQSDVNDLGGKSLTLVFVGVYGEEFEYTIIYQNEDN
ncbi:hypothetical protein CQS04_07015 [Chryseomicrobium excrementi]|uniref:SLH domain-containing protein n=1 Tax=Chryseomicrobium excrementi TaxID=2041346 RepID=A0A2M9F0B4_9BACL|nr:S-layer homology domain-containing protein [Chryseomicrobium excrementi]PJK16896.1 hypothetical protein CQS04_07015 [Chryseomicrobium excrementi]